MNGNFFALSVEAMIIFPGTGVTWSDRRMLQIYRTHTLCTRWSLWARLTLKSVNRESQLSKVIINYNLFQKTTTPYEGGGDAWRHMAGTYRWMAGHLVHIPRDRSLPRSLTCPLVELFSGSMQTLVRTSCRPADSPHLLRHLPPPPRRQHPSWNPVLLSGEFIIVIYILYLLQ